MARNLSCRLSAFCYRWPKGCRLDLHEADVLHRDVKLSNLLLNDAGTVELADFGIAISQHQQRPGEVLGSAAYMDEYA